jgi:phosphoadenosine phosphosulfate reductase
MREKAPYNVLYERHLDRIGCFMCPSSDMALLHMIEKEYPALWQGWLDRLEHYRHAHNLPQEWVSEGRWRLAEGGKDEEDSHY